MSSIRLLNNTVENLLVTFNDEFEEIPCLSRKVLHEIFLERREPGSKQLASCTQVSCKQVLQSYFS